MCVSRKQGNKSTYNYAKLAKATTSRAVSAPTKRAEQGHSKTVGTNRNGQIHWKKSPKKVGERNNTTLKRYCMVNSSEK